MSSIFNKKGERFQTGIGGTYRANDGDPQNDVDCECGAEDPEDCVCNEPYDDSDDRLNAMEE